LNTQNKYVKMKTLLSAIARWSRKRNNLQLLSSLKICLR